MNSQLIANMSFEQAIRELNKIIDKMEQGDLPLDQALERFQRGIEVTRHCQSTLKNAEQQVKILLNNNQLANLDNNTDVE